MTFDSQFEFFPKLLGPCDVLLQGTIPLKFNSLHIHKFMRRQIKKHHWKHHKDVLTKQIELAKEAYYFPLLTKHPRKHPQEHP